MNSINLLGRITKELEIKESGSGNKYLHLTLAVRRRKQNETDFIPIVAFGKVAETIATYCEKGQMLGITGRLEINTKQENGQWETRVNVIADDFTFTDKKGKEENKKESDNKETSLFENDNGLDELFKGYEL